MNFEINKVVYLDPKKYKFHWHPPKDKLEEQLEIQFMEYCEDGNLEEAKKMYSQKKWFNIHACTACFNRALYFFYFFL